MGKVVRVIFQLLLNGTINALICPWKHDSHTENRLQTVDIEFVVWEIEILQTSWANHWKTKSAFFLEATIKLTVEHNRKKPSHLKWNDMEWERNWNEKRSSSHRLAMCARDRRDPLVYSSCNVCVCARATSKGHWWHVFCVVPSYRDNLWWPPRESMSMFISYLFVSFDFFFRSSSFFCASLADAADFVLHLILSELPVPHCIFSVCRLTKLYVCVCVCMYRSDDLGLAGHHISERNTRVHDVCVCRLLSPRDLFGVFDWFGCGRYSFVCSTCMSSTSKTFYPTKYLELQI